MINPPPPAVGLFIVNPLFPLRSIELVVVMLPPPLNAMPRNMHHVQLWAAALMIDDVIAGLLLKVLGEKKLIGAAAVPVSVMALVMV